MDWGLGNPNKTATLIATLLVAVWGLCAIRRFGFWIALALFTGLGVCEIHTFSRGGILAAAAGLSILLWNIPRPWPKRGMIAVVLSIWVMTGITIYLQAHERLGKGIVQEDRSISNRIKIWKDAPKMMVDAPQGWGLGKSGSAYMQWYQELGRNEVYRTLVNSHLTWMVEFGWMGRFFYLFAWGAVLLLCWPKPGLWAIPFSVWTTFGVAAWFSSVAESPWLWIVPSGALIAAVIRRVRNKDWPRKRSWMAVLIISLLILLGICYLGRGERNIPVGGKVISKGMIWVLNNPKVQGSKAGKSLRKYLTEHTDVSISMVEKLEEISSLDGNTLMILGEVSAENLTLIKATYLKLGRLILVNPAFSPEELPNLDKCTVYYGEFSQSEYANVWRDKARVIKLEGTGDFVSNWMKLLK